MGAHDRLIAEQTTDELRRKQAKAKQRGVKIVINTDSHHTSHLEKIRFGVLQARRAWLTKQDVLNTLPLQRFRGAMKHAW